MNSIKLLVLVAIACAGIAHAASFDCAKAHSKVEKMICVDAELSRLDDDLSARYQQVWNEYQQDEEIRQVQKQWLKSRDACRDVKCLSNHYTQRLASLKEPFLAPFGYYLNESLPQQRRTPVCKDFKHYLNYPRSNALFNPDGTLVRESDLFKSVC